MVSLADPANREVMSAERMVAAELMKQENSVSRVLRSLSKETEN
jgi:hypothetical protein